MGGLRSPENRGKIILKKLSLSAMPRNLGSVRNWTSRERVLMIEVDFFTHGAAQARIQVAQGLVK